MTKTKSNILALLALMLFTAPAFALSVTVDGVSYEINGFSTNYAENTELFESQVWWGDSELAYIFASAVSATAGAGSNFDNYGPYFAYQHQLDDGRGWDFVNAWTQNPGGGIDHNPPGDPWNYGYAFAVAVPEPFTLTLLLSGLVGIGFARRSKKA